MAQNLGCLFIILKIVDFKVNNNILWNTQNAPDRTIFIFLFAMHTKLSIHYNENNLLLSARPNVRLTKRNLVRRQWIDVKFDVMGM